MLKTSHTTFFRSTQCYQPFPFYEKFESTPFGRIYKNLTSILYTDSLFHLWQKRDSKNSITKAMHKTQALSRFSTHLWKNTNINNAWNPIPNKIEGQFYWPFKDLIGGVYCFNWLLWTSTGSSHWEVFLEINLNKKTLTFYTFRVHWKNRCRSTVRKHAVMEQTWISTSCWHIC